MRFNCPSPAPMLVCGFMPAVGGCPTAPPPPPPPPPLLHAAATSVNATAIKPSRIPFLPLISPPPDRRRAGPPRPPPFAPVATRGGPFGPRPRARAGRNAASARPPRDGRPLRGPRRSV